MLGHKMILDSGHVAAGAVEALAKAIRDLDDLATFTRRVRLLGSGLVAGVYSRLDTWKRERAERLAQAAVERRWA